MLSLLAILFPPETYDRPYNGNLVTLSVEIEEVQVVCRSLAHLIEDEENLSTGRIYGCSLENNGHCLVIIPNDTVDGITPQQVYIHERAHCNGWPRNHPQE